MPNEKDKSSISSAITTKLNRSWQAAKLWTRKPKVQRAAKNTAVFLGGAATTALLWAARNSKYFTK